MLPVINVANGQLITGNIGIGNISTLATRRTVTRPTFFGIMSGNRADAMAKKRSISKTIIVGTYRPENEAWIAGRRLYNLPLPKCGKLAFHEAVSGIVLFAEGHRNFAFKARFKDVVDGAWLKRTGYSLAAKPHGEKYALYELYEESTPAKLLGDRAAEVFVSSSRCPCVKIDEVFYSKPYPVTGGRSMPYVFDCLKPYFRKWKSATTFNPIQMDFLNMITDDKPETVPFPAPKKWKFTFIDLFAGIGGIRLGYQALGGKCVFSSEWDAAAAKTYYYNFGERPCGDIQKIDPKSIPDFDVLLAGFPCQPFSIIGDKEGFNHETQGTLFFSIEKILLTKRPKAFMLENVRNLTAHDGGRTFKVILSHLQRAGYDIHYKVLNALDYGVPQKRERIIICGFRKPVKFDFPAPVPQSERKTVADIIDADAENDKSLFVRSSIRKSRLARLKDRNYPRPYISHENVAGSITPHPYSCALRAGASANYILINDERRPSPREMLRIQGFPDEFRIVVNYGQIKHQTGNSVAVPVIRAVAREVVSHLKEV